HALPSTGHLLLFLSSDKAEQMVSIRLQARPFLANIITCENLPLLTQWVCRVAFCALRAPRLGNGAQALVPRSRLFRQPCVRASQANGGSKFLRCRDRRRSGLS